MSRAPTIAVSVRNAWPDCETSDGFAVDPRLDRAVGAEVVFEALPLVGRETSGGGDAVGGEVGKSGVVGFPDIKILAKLSCLQV